MHILILDSDDKSRTDLQISISKCTNYQVTTRPTARAGLAFLKSIQKRHWPDVVISSTELRDMPLTELISRIRKTSLLPIIARTDDAERALESLTSGADQVFSKSQDKALIEGLEFYRPRDIKELWVAVRDGDIDGLDDVMMRGE